METFVKELINAKTTDLENIVKLVINTVKAKALYRKGSWELVRKELGNRYMNPNFTMHYGTIYQLLDELDIKVEISIKNELSTIANMVNEKLGVVAVEYRIDRKAHYLIIVI